MKNLFIGSGEATNIRVRKYGETDFLDFTLRVPDTVRVTAQGTPYTYGIQVKAGGPLAARLKDTLKDGLLVVVQGRFEPSKDKENVWRYPVSAQSIELMDGGIQNFVMVQGRLTHDPNLQVTAKGNAICTASIASSQSYKGKDGQWKEIVFYIPITAWNDEAKKLAEFAKGSLIWVSGQLVNQKWTDAQGTDHWKVHVNVASTLPGGTGKRNVIAGKTGTDNSTSQTVDATFAVHPYPEDSFMEIGDDEDLPF